MTEVRYSKREDRHYLCCEGHAKGSQDVCAAVSTLAYTLAGYLANANIWSEVDMDEAYAEIVFDSDDPKLDAAWEMTVFGLKQLQHTFGDYVRVTCIQ